MTKWHYSGEKIVQETVETPSGQLLRTSEFAYGPEGDDDIVAEFRTENGNPEETRYFLKDRLGSVVAVTDGSGAVLEEYRYGAFGKTYRKDTEGNWEALRPGQQTATDRPYTGRERDAETGLYHYRARAYSPELWRFLQRDPVWTADQLNRYAYVGNNPMVATDPSGMVAKRALKDSMWQAASGPAAFLTHEAGYLGWWAYNAADSLSFGYLDGWAGLNARMEGGDGMLAYAWNGGREKSYLLETASVLPALPALAIAPYRIAAGIKTARAAKLAAVGMSDEAAMVERELAWARNEIAAGRMKPNVGGWGQIWASWWATAGKRFTPQQRLSTFEKYDGRCAVCWKQTHLDWPSSPSKAETDHIVARIKWGNTTENNAQNLCRTCNRKKWSMDMFEFLKKFFNNE